MKDLQNVAEVVQEGSFVLEAPQQLVLGHSCARWAAWAQNLSVGSIV